jgi:hypothetical protein
MRTPGSTPSSLSNRQSKALKHNLDRLGYGTYADYLAGPEWADARSRYRTSGKVQRCLVCRAPNVDLHHRTYLRLGNERVDDLVALCRGHHELLHDEGLSLWDGPAILHKRELETRRPRSSAGVTV